MLTISKLVKTKTNSKYCLEYLDETVRLLVLIMPKVTGYINKFKVKEKDKDKSNKLMYLSIKHQKVLQKYKAIWTKIKDFKNI